MNIIAFSIFFLQFFATGMLRVVPCNTLDHGYLVFHCADGETCVRRSEDFCNGVQDCPDGSDEYIFNISSEWERGMECPKIQEDGSALFCHLPERYKCDHEIDCYGGQDECGCRHSFQCADGGCALRVKLCDGTPDCRDGSDEMRFNRTSKIGFQCPVTRFHETHYCVLPDEHVCDGDSDCDDGIDECFCDFSSGKGVLIEDGFSNSKCYRCFDGTLILPDKYVCDEIIHCGDMSDECICVDKKNFTMPDVCSSVCYGDNCSCIGDIQCTQKQPGNEDGCLPQSKICDMNIDCENGIDERLCPETQQYFQCRDNKTRIEKTKLCNGPYDCGDHSDETLCKEITDYYCFYYRFRFPFVTDWENRTQTNDPRVSIPPDISLPAAYPFHSVKCDGIPTCADLDDECYAPGCDGPRPGFCKFVHRLGIGFECENSGSIILGREVCDGKPSCNDTHPELSDDELYCPNRFYCHDKGETRLPIHIPMSWKCNGIQECADQSDEMGCSETTHFYCNDSGETKFIGRHEVCDGTMDCHSGVDECQNCNPSPFSNDERVIKSRVLVAFLWIIGLIAIAGNVTVMIYHLKKSLGRNENEVLRNPVAQVNGILVLNLCFADILLGVYMLALAIKDASTTRYCKHDQEWRTSVACASLGTIALAGSEAATFLIALMAGYRAFIVTKPFSNGKKKVAYVCVGCAWLLAALVALIPHSRGLADYFVSCVKYSFGLLCRSDLERITQEFYVRARSSRRFTLTSDRPSWNTLFAVIAELNSSYVPEKYFGYYSAHSVCLPRIFPDRRNDHSWAYTLYLIILNFCCLVFVVLCYVQIYRVTTKETLAYKVRKNERDSSLQRKISRIVFTNICCWSPICIMALITVGGGTLPETAYAVTATIILPANAALNPFLYSNIIDLIWNKMKPIREWFGATSCGKQRNEQQSPTKTTAESEIEGNRRPDKNGTLESRM